MQNRNSLPASLLNHHSHHVDITSAHLLSPSHEKSVRTLSIQTDFRFGGALDWIRTNDTRFRKPVLYPLSYEGGLTHNTIK